MTNCPTRQRSTCRSGRGAQIFFEVGDGEECGGGRREAHAESDGQEMEDVLVEMTASGACGECTAQR